ncbi:auxin efflux carrier [Gautieria morchelliformis]|nr:auxin efflux carrier [Gautieria morchelliformis]
MAFSRAGFLIYSGIMPLIKTFLTILFGYVLARKGRFTPAASRGASQVTMNISLPALIFSNIVPAFSAANVSAILPLLVSAFAYEGMGFVFGLIIREVCYVPRNFYQGLVVLTGMSNWGNLPTAVVLTVTQEPPFNPNTDPALGVSFVAIFILSYHLVFWVCGAAHSLSWDYLPNVPQGEAAERRVSWKEKPIGGWIARVLLGHTPVVPEVGPSSETEKAKETTSSDLGHALESNINMSDRHVDHDLSHAEPDTQLTPHISSVSVTSFRSRQTSASVLPSFRAQGTASSPYLPAELTVPPSTHPHPGSSTAQSTSPGLHESKSQIPRTLPPFLSRIFRPLSNAVTPITITLSVSLVIALIRPLKALFVDTTQAGGPNWKGPDGRPPLSFVIDTATLVGGITVPMALIVLGASFARLTIPRPLSRLPIPAMVLAGLAKMFFLPVIGIFMVQAMVNKGLIPRENKAERFVAMFLSGTPAAVNQLIVSQLYAPDGNVDTLSAFLLVQYILMFFSSAALTAVSLALL